MIRWFIVIALAGGLAACEVKQRLEGKRISVFDLEKKLRVVDPKKMGKIILPRSKNNKSWPQIGGNVQHAVQHVAFAAGNLHEIWRVEAGEGSNPLQAPPIMAQGKVFVLDSEAHLRAFDSATGKEIWQKKFSFDEGGFGGGLAYDAGRVFVATGFGTAAALGVIDGTSLWRKERRVPFRAVPVVLGERVYFMSFNNRLTAYDVSNGRELWAHQGISEASSLLMPTAVAVQGGIVVAPYNSGEIYALNANDKSFVWTDNLLRQALATKSDSAGFIAVPTIDSGHVYIISNAGYVVAINLKNGKRVWSQNIGGGNMPWVAGEQIYVVAEEGLLLCLSRRNGLVLWRTSLPADDDVHWYGPILAGGILWLTSSDGRLARISPVSGKPIAIRQMADGFQVAPIVANQTMFLLSTDMMLIALKSKAP